MARRPKAKRRRRLKPASPEVAGGSVRYPFVALLGRPNVGKSSLFNRLVGRRLAIEEPTAGTTRDRIAAIFRLDDGRPIELCDMGGVGGTGDPHDKNVNVQIDLALDYADVILFVVDARAGLTPMDEEIGRRIQRLGKPVVLVANKVESRQVELTANEFYALGLPSELVCVSAKEGTGRSDLIAKIQEVVDDLPVRPPEEAEAAEDVEDEHEDEHEHEHEQGKKERLLRVAIVGRRNVGKSTYVNAVFGSERVIASSQAGTTRDAVDVQVEVHGRPCVLIDTAGLRKRGRADDQIEIISHNRAMEAVRRSDVVLLLLDCLDEISQVDKRLAGAIQDEHKACVIVANKWDLVGEGMTSEQYADYVGRHLPGLGYAPLVTISAQEGDHVTAPLRVAFDLYEQSLIRVKTGELNRSIAAAIERRRPKPKKNQIGKVYFCTQVAVNPVTLLLFVNDPHLFEKSWRRYLAGQLRQSLPWEEIPIKLCFRARESLYKKGGGLARRVRALGGLAERARVIDVETQGGAELDRVAPELDARDVQEALLDAFGDSEDPEPQGPPE